MIGSSIQQQHQDRCCICSYKRVWNSTPVGVELLEDPLKVCDVCQQLLLLAAVAGEACRELACAVCGVLHSTGLAAGSSGALQATLTAACGGGYLGLGLEQIQLCCLVHVPVCEACVILKRCEVQFVRPVFTH